MTEESVLAALIRRGRELNAAKADIDAQLKDIKDKIAAVIPAGSTIKVDDVPCQVRAPRRAFDMNVALGLLPPDVRLSCVESVISQEKVKEAAELAGVLDKAMVPGVGGPSVILG